MVTKPGAPRGNKNRVGKGSGRGKNINLSMPREEWEAFCAANEVMEGHVLSEEEHKEIWRSLDRSIRKSHIERYQANVDPEIMVY